MLLVVNLIAILGASCYAVLRAEVQGEGTAFIDLQKYREVSLVADFFT